MMSFVFKQCKFLACTAVVLGSVIGLSGAEQVYFKENFRNYTDFAPNVVKGVDGIYLGNDPIWAKRAELNVNVADKAVLIYPKGIAVPQLKNVDFQFRFRITNAKNPVSAVPAQKDAKGNVKKAAVAAVPGEAKGFEVLINRTVVRIMSDSVTLNGQIKRLPFLLPGDWSNAAFRIANGKLTVYVAADRKLAQCFEIPFTEPVTSFNLQSIPGNAFSVTDLSVTSGGKLVDNPVTKHYADFRSLSQPLPAGAVKTDVTLTPDAKGYAGAVLKLNKVDTTLQMILYWDNGAKSNYNISAKGTSIDRLLTNVRGKFRGEAVQLADAEIAIAPGFRQRIRSVERMSCRGNGGPEPQYTDILRDWDNLPSASAHPLNLDFATLPNGGVQFFIDGSYAGNIDIPAKPLAKGEKKTDATPKAKLVKIELKGNGISDVLAKKNRYARIDDKYYVVDLSASPRAKAFADAKSNLKPGVQLIGKVPYDVAKPMDSGDVAICKQGKGIWALEVEEYHARSPFEGFPSSVHFRVPAAPYSMAHMLVAIDPDPAKDKILTVRMSRYNGNGIGGNLVGDTTLDLSDGKIPSDFKQVGTLTKDGKEIPLYQVDVKLNLSKISDLAARGTYLDLDFVGKNGENTEQLDDSVKPDPLSDSAFNIFAITLEKLPVMMDFTQKSPGNIFTEDEEKSVTVNLKAMRDTSFGTLYWTAKDSNGRVAFIGKKAFSLKKAGDKVDIPIELKGDVGYYDLKIALGCNDCAPLFHAGRFAILAKDERTWSNTDSPYATWWFTAHGSPGAMEIGGPIMQKAGIRKSCNAPTLEAKEKYNINFNGNLYVGAEMGDLDVTTGHFKDTTIEVPDPKDPKKKIKKQVSGEEAFVWKVKSSMKPYLHYDHIMIWHESGPGYGIPEELMNQPLSEKAKEMIEGDKKLAMYIKECGRIVRKHFPNLRIQIGNSSASVGSVVRPLRADPSIAQYYDRIGIEIPSQVVMPEKLQECGFQGMMIGKEAALKLTGKKIKADGCWEFIYRPARDMGEQQQAEWHMRDILISLANDFNLISIGLLFDCTNGYYNHFYGASGIVDRAPYVYPKRAYVAYAALTSALDNVQFVRQMDTGSTTVYALEFKRADGTYAYAFWSARGSFEVTLDNSDNSYLFGLLNAKAKLTEFFGRQSYLSGDTLTIQGGTAPVYLNVKNALKSVKIVKRSFPEEEARAAKSALGSPFNDVALMEPLNPDQMVTSHQTSYLPIMKPGDFSIKNVNDPEKGQSLQVALNTKTNPYKSHYITEFTTVRLKKPIPVQGEPVAIGVWVKGNSNWGQIRFEIEDAQGEVFKGISTDGWGCDVYDWPGNTSINFDGWCYVAQPLIANVFCNHSPGPVSEQWVSCGGDKKIDFPIKVRAITVGFNRYKLDLLEFKDSSPAILLKDFGGVLK